MRACRRFFIKNPEPKAHPYELIPATNNIVQEFADLLGAYLRRGCGREDLRRRERVDPAALGTAQNGHRGICPIGGGWEGASVAAAAVLGKPGAGSVVKD